MAEYVVTVELAERSYPIRIATGLVDRVGSAVAQGQVSRVAVVSDAHVRRIADRVTCSLIDHGWPVDHCEVPAGERSKCVAEAERLWSWLADRAADRKTLLIAVGGGVVGDLAGFVAATYGRGIPLAQVPTTLLAQVDSSIGGKVGINLPQVKNMVGAFWQPQWVAIDPQTLESLPDREYRSGMAEVVKYGAILDADFFALLESQVSALNQRDPRVLSAVIARCCQLKADVVRQDERDATGVRAVLNYGHTFAHAFETLTGYGTLLHGEAVAIGMLCAARLAYRLGRIPRQLIERQEQLLRALHLPTAVPPLDRRDLIACMSRDKKAEQGRLRFVLPTRLGCVELVADVDSEVALAALEG